MREPALAACLLWPRALSDVSLDVSSGKFVGIGLEWGPKDVSLIIYQEESR